MQGITIDKYGVGNNYNADHFPVEAVDALEESGLPEGNMFNLFQWGGYLLYRLWPEKLVFIDSWSDFFGEDHIKTYLDIEAAEGDWQQALDAYDISWVILPANRPLSKFLDLSSEWEVVYHDEIAIVFVRH
jgi:hypothetical protein